MLQVEAYRLCALPLHQKKKSFLKASLRQSLNLQSTLQPKEPQFWINAEDQLKILKDKMHLAPSEFKPLVKSSISFASGAVTDRSPWDPLKPL